MCRCVKCVGNLFFSFLSVCRFCLVELFCPCVIAVLCSFELCLIIWNTDDIVLQDFTTRKKMSDIFVRGKDNSNALLDFLSI